MARDVYLAVRGNGGGSGTQGDPYDAGSPDAFDGILTRFTSDTDFHYAAGTYRTRGYSYQRRSTAHVRCRHHGAGVDQTIIQLVDASDTSRAEGLMFNGDNGVDGFELHDLTLDCNAAGNPVFQQHRGTAAAFFGIGRDILLQNLKVIHFGTAHQGSEDFVMMVWPNSGSRGQTFNNITFDSIVFTQPASGNADGVTISAIGGAEGVTVNGKIVNCKYIDCRSDFVYSHAFVATDCENNYVQNVSDGVYFEPDDYRDFTWTVKNNTFVGVDYGLTVKWHPGAHLGRILFDNNHVALSNMYTRRAALGVDDGGLNNGDASANISYIEFNNNTVNLQQNGGNVPISLVSALDFRSPGHHYWIDKVVASGNNISLPGHIYNVQPDVVHNGSFDHSTNSGL